MKLVSYFKKLVQLVYFFTSELSLIQEIKDKADKKTKIRNRYNWIPRPALNTKREKDTYN